MFIIKLTILRYIGWNIEVLSLVLSFKYRLAEPELYWIIFILGLTLGEALKVIGGAYKSKRK